MKSNKNFMGGYPQFQMEYANRIGVTIPGTHEPSKDVKASVNAAIAWSQDKFAHLKALIDDNANLYTEAAKDYGDFSNGLIKCRDSLDTAERSFRTAVRKLLAAGVDVNPRCESEARAPMNPKLISDPALVRDLISSLFTVDEDIGQLKNTMEVGTIMLIHLMFDLVNLLILFNCIGSGQIGR